MMKASLTFYPNLSKKSAKTGKIPLYCRVGLNAKKAETRLTVDIHEKELLKWDPMTMRLIDRNHNSNRLLNKIDQKFQDFLILNMDLLYTYSPKEINDYLFGNGKAANHRVLNYLESYFSDCLANNTGISPGTLRNYRNAINQFAAFARFRQLERIQLSELSNSVALDFKNYLVSSYPVIEKKGMSEVSATNIIKKFRTICDRAVDQGLLASNPFKAVKLKSKSPRKPKLTISQVALLNNIEFAHFPIQTVYRDICLFSVFTGLSNKDAMMLNWSNLEFRPNGEIKLTINRAKTDVPTELFLVKQAREIIDRYKSPDKYDTGLVLPRRSNKELNVQLKILANMVNIPIRLTSHTARHTFRQLLSEASIEDYGVIKRMMGQSRRGDVDEVYYSVTEARLLDAKERFENFLTQNLDI